MKDETTIRGQAHQDTIHDSAVKHVTGRADYTDDLAEPHGLLHAYLGCPNAPMAGSPAWIFPKRWPIPAWWGF